MSEKKDKKVKEEKAVVTETPIVENETVVTEEPVETEEPVAKTVETYMDRLNIERDELQEKTDKLAAALRDKKVPKTSIAILRGQLKVMNEYLDILNFRIKNSK